MNGREPDTGEGSDREPESGANAGLDHEPEDAVPRSDAPTTDLGFLTTALETASADAFVAVGDRFDDDLRYLSRFSGPDRDFALVVTATEAVLCAPALFAEQAAREFVESAPGSETLDRSLDTASVGDPAGKRAARVVTDRVGPTADLLVPQGIPHDAAVYLEGAGHEITSTAAVTEARTVKTDVEIERLRYVQRATARGMARAETILAESVPAEDVPAEGVPADGVPAESEGGGPGANDDGPVLVWNGGLLSTERLRRQVNATLAAYGVRDAGNTVIGVGPSAADLHYTGVDLVRPGETVLLDVSPRGPHGYYGDLTRTFVVDGDGGWERRAYVAVEAARTAALAEIEAGVSAATVHEEAAAELGAYGFDPRAGEGEAGFTHGTGHGVGVSLHEAPSLSADVELRPGHVVTVEPGVYDPEIGGVRLEDLVLVTGDGYEILHEYPFGIVPERRR